MRVGKKASYPPATLRSLMERQTLWLQLPLPDKLVTTKLTQKLRDKQILIDRKLLLLPSANSCWLRSREGNRHGTGSQRKRKRGGGGKR